jgi:hypothetical protein
MAGGENRLAAGSALVAIVGSINETLANDCVSNLSANQSQLKLNLARHGH